MFTGLIQETGTVAALDFNLNQGQIIVRASLVTELKVGDSIAVNGVCLTAVKLTDSSFSAEVSPETFERTCLKRLKEGDRVNLERALRLGDTFGGHIVQGHVDGIGHMTELTRYGEFWLARVRYPQSLSAYVIEKGSIAVDGVSLTINRLLDPDRFELMIIPHTWTATRFSHYEIGEAVNLEVDMLGKYVERILKVRGAL